MNMLLTNNARRFAGLAPHRKSVKGRDKNMEVISAFLDYCDGKYEGRCKKITSEKGRLLISSRPFFYFNVLKR